MRINTNKNHKNQCYKGGTIWVKNLVFQSMKTMSIIWINKSVSRDKCRASEVSTEKAKNKNN